MSTRPLTNVRIMTYCPNRVSASNGPLLLGTSHVDIVHSVLVFNIPEDNGALSVPSVFCITSSHKCWSVFPLAVRNCNRKFDFSLRAAFRSLAKTLSLVLFWMIQVHHFHKQPTRTACCILKAFFLWHLQLGQPTQFLALNKILPRCIMVFFRPRHPGSSVKVVKFCFGYLLDGRYSIPSQTVFLVSYSFKCSGKRYCVGLSILTTPCKL